MSRKRQKGRAINGLLLLDKTAGITSNLALQKVKKIFSATKAGHTGSLDPLATGMLIVCFGKATKISNYLLNADKRYEVTLLLGVTTTTGDADGTVLEEKDTSMITEGALLQAIKKLTGTIEQIPPMYSAIKYQGKRLHQLARQGIEVERQPREIQIYKFELVARAANCLHMHVHCSKGTYIRSLVEDLGKILNCGAHVIELRRTSVGPFVNSKMHTIDEFEQFSQQPLLLDRCLIPIEAALEEYPVISLHEELMQQARNGHPVKVANCPPSGLVRIYDEYDSFYGLGTVQEDGSISPKCLN